MPPLDLSTVRMPLATTHCAGDLSPIVTHSSSLLPSKRTMASEGGAPQVAPGVTTAGTGSQYSVSSGLGLGAAWAGDCAKSGAARAMRAAELRRLEKLICSHLKKIHLSGQGWRECCSGSLQSSDHSRA